MELHDGVSQLLAAQGRQKGGERAVRGVLVHLPQAAHGAVWKVAGQDGGQGKGQDGGEIREEGFRPKRSGGRGRLGQSAGFGHRKFLLDSSGRHGFRYGAETGLYDVRLPVLAGREARRAGMISTSMLMARYSGSHAYSDTKLAPGKAGPGRAGEGSRAEKASSMFCTTPGKAFPVRETGYYA